MKRRNILFRLLGIEIGLIIGLLIACPDQKEMFSRMYWQTVAIGCCALSFCLDDEN